MTLVKKPKAKEPEKKEPTDYETVKAALDRNEQALKDLSARIDKLVESDRQVHDKIDPPKPEPEPKPEKPDLTDKKDELTDKIENS